MIKVKCCFNTLEGHSAGISLGPVGGFICMYTEYFIVSLGLAARQNNTECFRSDNEISY